MRSLNLALNLLLRGLLLNMHKTNMRNQYRDNFCGIRRTQLKTSDLLHDKPIMSYDAFFSDVSKKPNSNQNSSAWKFSLPGINRCIIGPCVSVVLQLRTPSGNHFLVDGNTSYLFSIPESAYKCLLSISNLSSVRVESGPETTKRSVTSCVLFHAYMYVLEVIVQHLLKSILCSFPAYPKLFKRTSIREKTFYQISRGMFVLLTFHQVVLIVATRRFATHK